MRQAGNLDGQGIGFYLTTLFSGSEPLLCALRTDAGEYSLYVDSRGARLDRFSGEFRSKTEDVAVETGLLNEVDMLKVMARAVEAGLGFLDAAVQMGRLFPEKTTLIAERVLEGELAEAFAATAGEYEIDAVDAEAAESARDPNVPAFFFSLDRLISSAAGGDGAAARAALGARDFYRADSGYLEQNRKLIEEEGSFALLSALSEPRQLLEAAKDAGMALPQAVAAVYKHAAAGGVSRLDIKDLKAGYKAALQGGDALKALSHLRRAFEIDKFDTEVTWALAELFEKSGEKTLAAAFYEFDGGLHASRGEEIEAGRAFEKVGELNPENRAILERLFEYRLSSGSMRKAVKTGTILASEAMKTGDVERGAKYFERLLEAAPEDFGLRVDVAKARLALRDPAGAFAQIEKMESLAAHGFPRGFDSSTIKELLEETAKLDPDNPAIKNRLAAFAPKQTAAPKGRSKIPMAALIVLFLAVAGGGAAFFFISGGHGGDGPGMIGPGAKGGQAKKADPRENMMAEAEKFFLAGETGKAVAKLKQALKAGPSADKTGQQIGRKIKEIEDLARQKEMAELQMRLEKDIRRADYYARGPMEKVEEALLLLDQAEKEAAQLEEPADPGPDAPPTLISRIAKARIALLTRKQEIFLMAGQNELDRDGGSFDKAGELLRQAAEAGPDGEIRTKALETLQSIDSYMAESETCYMQASAALEELKRASGAALKPAVEKTHAAMRKLYSRYPRSPQAKRSKYPVLVITDPPGAFAVISGGEITQTPALMMYEPWLEDASVSVTKDGFKPSKILLDGSKAVIDLKLERVFLWTVKTGDSVEGGPATAGDTAFVGCRDGGVYSFKWSRNSAQRSWPPFKVNDIGGVKSIPLPWRDKLVISSATLGELWGLDLASGDPSWGPVKPGRMIEGGAVGIPGTPFVLVGDVGGSLFALNAGTGGVEWTAPVTGQGEGLHTTAAVFMKQGALFAGTTAGSLLKIDIKDGKVLWRVETGLKVGVTPMVLGNLILASVGSKLLAFDALSAAAPSKPAWSKQWISPISHAAFDGKNILVSDQSGSCFLLDPASGSQSMEIQFGGISDRPVTPVPVPDGLVLAGGQVITYWKQGRPKPSLAWKMQTATDINDPLVVSGNTVLLTTTDGQLMAATLD